MNYDHHYHAGNAADCIKHLALSLTLQALIRKDTPLAYIDTHAGAGNTPWARKGNTCKVLRACGQTGAACRMRAHG